jgi:hypothetical protein
MAKSSCGWLPMWLHHKRGKKNSLGTDFTPAFFFIGGVKFRQNEGHKIKERIFCYNILISVENSSKLEINKNLFATFGPLILVS